MDWTARINEKLEELGLYPDVEAFDVSDLRDHIVLTDTQEVTVYKSAEGCYRWLSMVERHDDEHETFDAVGQALHPQIVEDVQVSEDSGRWRVNHTIPDDEA